jgi:hypothetical protein
MSPIVKGSSLLEKAAQKKRGAADPYINGLFLNVGEESAQ